ncbi:MAG: PTS sugar transporter subunit IIA [Deltaproteobacteria bacterium]|jgi:PTS system nitrogen regulatory IIA component|nr:MAG: PTS sugar transporter subunit IIA [Deltaproteobacteria bacterium]
MKILDILDKECIIAELRSRTKREVLEELTGALLNFKANLDKEALVEILLERERLGSTGIGDGIAIPHGKVQDLDELVLSFGRSTQGIEFDSMDGRPTHLFFLLIAPENSAGIHLRALAKISRLLKSSQFRQRLLEAGTEEELFQVIQEEDKEL